VFVALKPHVLLQDKDVFAENYRHFLAQRLLSGKTLNNAFVSLVCKLVCMPYAYRWKWIVFQPRAFHAYQVEDGVRCPTDAEDGRDDEQHGTWPREPK